MWPWKANEKLIEALYTQVQTVIAEIEELKKTRESNVVEALKKTIAELLVSELKAAIVPEIIAEVKKSLNPPKPPQGVV
jgi:signal recognition particle GTPase